MKMFAVALAGVLTAGIVGCSPKDEARTGKEFLEKIQRAEREKDVDSYWKLTSAKSQEALLKAAREEIEKASKDEKALAAVREKYGVKDDPAKMKPEVLAKAGIKRRLEAGKTDFAGAKFVEEKATPNGVTLVVELPEKGRREISLVKEKDLLKIDWDSSPSTKG